MGDDAHWCMLVYYCVWVCRMMCTVIYGDIWWYMMMCYVALWCMVMRYMWHGAYWCTIMCDVVWGCVVVYDAESWCVMMPWLMFVQLCVMSCYVWMVCYGVWWRLVNVMVVLCMFMSVNAMVYEWIWCDVCWCMSMRDNMWWCVLMYDDV